ncbi:hypothetical protein [Rhodoplanes azumiensis]|uniref:Uncharacterized protein n=1 Tax=Rhodoplanes azumiensis TaxID=1897628 RepID=A0ABW5AIU8_9BRAD
MIVLDWIVAALVGGFVAAAAVEAQLYRDRKTSGARPRSERPPAAHGLWSVAEAAWIGAHGAGPRRLPAPEPDRPGFATAGAYDVRVQWAPDRAPRRRRRRR